jgi:hypothetical protein
MQETSRDTFLRVKIGPGYYFLQCRSCEIEGREIDTIFEGLAQDTRCDRVQVGALDKVWEQ